METRTSNEIALADEMALRRLEKMRGWELAISVKYATHIIATTFREKGDAQRAYEGLKKAVDVYHEQSNFKDRTHEIVGDDSDRRTICLKEVAEFYLNGPSDSDQNPQGENSEAG